MDALDAKGSDSSYPRSPVTQAPVTHKLTSALAPLIRLSYGRMLWMALPYTIVLTLTGLLATIYLL